MSGRQKMNPRRDPSSSFVTILLLLVAISVEKVRPQDLLYNSDPALQSNECYLDNVLQSFLTPDEVGSIQMQALREGLWRILTSPALNEKLILPNYDLLSDGKLMYDQPSYENKRSQSVFQRIITASPYFKKYLATMLKANSIQSRPSLIGKKSIATLAKNGQLPTLQSPEESPENDEEKRNLESLARLGGIHQYMKKNLESLMRNGYAYNKFYEENNENPFGKRNLGSLARNGELLNKNTPDSYYKRNIQNLMKTGRTVNGKRNIASLARNQNLPIFEENEKRNIGTIARDWAIPKQNTGWHRNGEDKRNVAALLRQDSYLHSVNRNSAIDAFPTPEAEEVNQPENKRNLPSIKTGPFKYGKVFKRSVAEKNEPKVIAVGVHNTPIRHKRQADEYFSEISSDFPLPEVPKSDAFDYDELVKALTGDYVSNKKRFLGNIPLSRMTELGKISLMGQPPMSNATPTSPTYRRRQYLLSRTQQDDNE